MNKLQLVDKYPVDMDFRDKIDALEKEMHGMETIPVEDFPIRHHFGGGMYARELFIPAGTIITGKIKKHEYISVLSMGDVYEATEHSKRHIKAPYTMVSAPGTKRLLYAVTDVVWTTIHKSDETDLEKLEKELILDNYALEDLTCRG